MTLTELKKDYHNDNQAALDFDGTHSSSVKALGGQDYLKHSDLPQFSSAMKRIADLLRDFQWHSANEIIQVSGQREGLRRLRDLRVRAQAKGNDIICERRKGRESFYKLVRGTNGENKNEDTTHAS